MGIAMFIIFIFTDLIMTGAFALVYSGNHKYIDGMILGVHIPESEINRQEVQKLTGAYRLNLKRFNLWNLLAGIAICFLCFYKVSFFFLIWTIWLLIYIFAGMGIIYRSHWKMYQLKLEHQWILPEKTHVVHIDTALSAMADQLPVSHWWNLPVVAGIGASFLLPQVSAFFGTDSMQWIFPAALFFTALLFWGLHLWFAYRRTRVFSMDSSINLSVNRMEKRIFSILFLCINYLNLISWGYLILKLQIIHWLYFMDYMIYVGLQIIPVFILLSGIVYIRKKRKVILSMNSEPLTVDDDEYWKYGWYNNPNDSSLFVPDRFNSTNYSLNMARPGVKVFAAITGIVVTALLVGSIILIAQFENVSITFSLKDKEVNINASLYSANFETTDIRDVELLDQLPDDDFIRTNGGATEDYLIGHFRGKDTGKCMMFVYTDDSPVLKIELSDKTIFVNSKNKNDVRNWYQLLKQ